MRFNTDQIERLKVVFRPLKALFISGCMLFPVKKNTALFWGLGGQYNDNAKYISLCLHERKPDIQIIWAISAKNRDRYPDYVKTVKERSLKFWSLSARAQVTVDYTDGIRWDIVLSNTWWGAWLTKLSCRRRPRQYCIATWHGTPLKRIGFDSLEDRSAGRKGRSCADYVLAGCSYTKRCLESAFPFGAPVKLYGTPRNDILFGGADIQSLKEKLRLPHDKKIVLFAPTYRNDVDSSGLSQMRQIDFAHLFDELERRFGGEWVFVFRVHQMVLLNIDTASLAAKYGDRIVDGNVGDDMMEYLICTDVLITDYSGSMFDFALTGRPCFLYAPDREHYEKVERGFYMDYDELPFPKAYSPEELIDMIKSFDGVSYEKNVNKFLETIGNVEDGHAAERVVDDIIHFIETGEKR